MGTLEWAAASVGRGARVDSMMVLEGGGACAIHALDVLDVRGMRHPLVLKRFFRRSWVAREPDIALREARVLEALATAPLPTPELVAVDPDGSHCDHPALLMTRLPGRVELAPRDLDAWLRAIAEPLLVIHALPERFHGLVKRYATYQQLDALRVPGWSSESAAWQEIIRFVQRPAPLSADCLLHRDYHPTNILFAAERVTGVLDWTNASHGPPGVDLSHCRLNLVQLYGVEVAERFLAVHRVVSGETHLDAAWDAYCLVETLPEPSVYWGWLNLGVTGLTVERVRRRLDEYARLVASRL